MKRINFFFDIDGTLLPFGKGIPESALQAILKAHEEGHRIFLSSGRSTAEIDPRLCALPLSGGVFSAGATCVVEGKTIYDRILSEEEKEYVFSYVKKRKYYLLAQAADGTYLKRESLNFFVSSLEKYIGRVIDIPNLFVVDEISESENYKKFLILSPDRNLDLMRAEYEKGPLSVVDNTVGLPQDMMAEIVLKDVTKATGIRKIISYLGEDMDSTVAVGDGANDIEMVKEAEFGIAMGNASEALKEVASFVTSDVEDNGLKLAIEKAVKVLS